MVTHGGSWGKNKILPITPRDSNVITSTEFKDHASPAEVGMNHGVQRLKRQEVTGIILFQENR